MVIGIDFRMMARGTRTGVEEYVYQISRALARAYPNDEFRLFYNAFRKAPLDYDWLKLPNVRLVESSLPNRVIDVTGVLFDWPKADRLLGGVDVFFSPHFFWTSLERAPRVLTFHDLSFLHYPEFFTWRQNIWHTRMFIKTQIARSRRLIAVSESTKRDLMHYYRVPEEKIAVIYEGVDQKEFGPMPVGHPWIKEFRKRQNLPDRFFLFLGALEPRKNALGALAAYELARTSGMIPPDLHFVIASNLGWLSGDVLRAAKSRSLDGVVHFSPVRVEDRKFLYNAAEALILPSFFEGFGLPPLEAMACGTPVITSNRSSLPEVVGNAGVMVDPFRPEEIAFAMATIVKDGAFRAKLREKGISAAGSFSWDKAAKDTFAIFEKVR